MATCNNCGGPIKAKGLCSKHYQQLKSTYIDRKCVCGSALPKYAHRFCHECAKENKRAVARKAKNKYRTKLEWMPNSLVQEIVKPLQCCICQRDIDYTLKWPHLLSPSIEHLLPLSRGGGNTLKNLTYTHLWCNIKRKNNIDLVHGDKVTVTERTINSMNRDGIDNMPVVLGDGTRLAVVAEHIIEDYIRLRKLEEENV